MRRDQSSKISKRMSRYPIPLVLFAIGLYALMSCNARVDGCLDPNAMNFDVTADNHDPSLCSYPSLLLSMVYSYGDTSFAKDHLFTNAMGQEYAFKDVYVLFSQFAITGLENPRMTVTNRTDWYLGTAGNGQYVEAIDDFTFVNASGFRFDIGMWRWTDFATQLDFEVGVPDTLTPTVLDSLPESSKLSDSRTFYNMDKEEFATARFVIARDSIQAEPDTFIVSSGPIHYTYPLNKELTRGRDDTVRVRIDFKVMFDQLDLNADSSVIAAELANTLSNSIFDNN